MSAGVVQWLESQPSKLVVWVRFPSPAPKEKSLSSGFLFSENTGIEPAVRSLAVPVVAALPLATADRGASFCSLYHPQDALATSPITRSIRGVVIVIENYF